MKVERKHPDLPNGYRWPVGHSATTKMLGVEYLVWIERVFTYPDGPDWYRCVGKPLGKPNEKEVTIHCMLEHLENII